MYGAKKRLKRKTETLKIKVAVFDRIKDGKIARSFKMCKCW